MRIIFNLGYYINRYASWHCIKSFDNPIDMIHWLKDNANSIDGPIDFIVESFKLRKN